MLNYIKTCEYLFLTFDVQFVTINTNRTVKSRQISNIHTHVFLEKCKTRALTRILKTGVPEPSLPKSGSPTIQKNIASFKK